MRIYRQHVTFVGSRYIMWKGYCMYFTYEIISMEYLYFLLVDLPL